MKIIAVLVTLIYGMSCFAQGSGSGMSGTRAAAIHKTSPDTASVPVPGHAPTAWRPGFLDIHHISTGRGNAAFCIMPDGTTMLVDAGELSPLDSRTFTARNAAAKPDTTRLPYEWLTNYISQVLPAGSNGIDYALITHFHDDHFGTWYPAAPHSSKGDFLLTGITGIAESYSIGMLFDRGFPSYRYPFDFRKNAAANGGGEIEFGATMKNYFAFTDAMKAVGMRQDSFRAGSNTQIRQLHRPADYPSFCVRNIKSARFIWSGHDSLSTEHFPAALNQGTKTPDENSLSLALTINYGPFIYYTGGDNPGELFIGDDPGRDIETPMAKAVGPVDVAIMDHHGNRDAINVTMIRTMHPQVWIGQTWSSDHPGPEVLRRLRNKAIYPKLADLFCTNMLESNRLVLGPIVDDAYKSQQGHIMLRVMRGGEQFYIIILDDTNPSLTVSKVFGPYQSSAKQLIN